MNYESGGWTREIALPYIGDSLIDNLKLYKCPDCGLVTAIKFNMTNHMSSHFHGRPVAKLGAVSSC